jgi:hypothetical protein
MPSGSYTPPGRRSPTGCPAAAAETRAKAQHALPGGQALPRDGLEISSSVSSCAEPMCSMSRDPRREECTICTAVAPDAVFTVRTYGTGPLYGPGLVRTFCSR